MRVCVHMFICVGMLHVYHPLLPLWQDFADELDAMPKITMVNNVIHNNQGYGVILVKPGDAAVEDLPAEPNAAGALFFFCLLLPPQFTISRAYSQINTS